ncbi:MAG: hypothetical protein Q9200_005367 [Gallowayella weberi]
MSRSNQVSIATLFGGSTDDTALLGPPNEETPAQPAKSPAPPNTPVTPAIKPGGEVHNLAPCEEELNQDSIHLPSPAVKPPISENGAKESSINKSPSVFPPNSDLDQLKAPDGSDRSEETASNIAGHQNGTPQGKCPQQRTSAELEKLAQVCLALMEKRKGIKQSQSTTMNTSIENSSRRVNDSPSSHIAGPKKPEANITCTISPDGTVTEKMPINTPKSSNAGSEGTGKATQTPLFQAFGRHSPTQHDIDSAEEIDYNDLPTKNKDTAHDPFPTSQNTRSEIPQPSTSFIDPTSPAKTREPSLEVAAGEQAKFPKPEFLGYESSREMGEGDLEGEMEYVDGDSADGKQDEDAMVPLYWL